MKKRTSNFEKKAVLLLSGGLDSGSLLFWLVNNGWGVVPLHVDYGQVSAPGEWRAVETLMNIAGLDDIIRVPIPGTSSLLNKSASTSEIQFNNNVEYFPSRNLLLLTVASISAYAHHIENIMIGFVKGTSELFPDTSHEFLNAIQKTLSVEHPDIILEAPFLNRTKIDVVSEAMTYGLLPDVTFCCNLMPNRHCWQCSSCHDRFTIFRVLGLM